MINKLLAYCLKKDLDNALNFLTNYSLWTKREEVFTACESVRFLLVSIEEEKEEAKRKQVESKSVRVHANNKRNDSLDLPESQRNNVSCGTIQKEDGEIR